MTDTVNSDSKYLDIFNLRFILPGNSLIKKYGERIQIGLRDATKKSDFDISDIITKNVKKARPDSILISGGIDSSILAAVAVKEFNDVRLVTAGVEGSEDVHYSHILADSLNKKEEYVKIDEGSVYHAIHELKSMGIDTYNVIMGVTEFLSAERAKTLGCKRIISGVGSDELFFGFYRHKTMKKEDLKAFREERLFYMGAFDLWRLNSIALKLNVSIFFPYLEDNFINFALSKDIDEITENYDKSLLRSFGKKIGLSEIIVERKKKAMQYGSGTVKLLRDLSRKKGYKNVGEFIKGI